MIPGGCSDDRYFHWYSDNRRLGPADELLWQYVTRQLGPGIGGNSSSRIKVYYLSVSIPGKLDRAGPRMSPCLIPSTVSLATADIVRVSRWRLCRRTLEPVPALWWSYGRNVLVTRDGGPGLRHQSSSRHMMLEDEHLMLKMLTSESERRCVSIGTSSFCSSASHSNKQIKLNMTNILRICVEL